MKTTFAVCLSLAAVWAAPSLAQQDKKGGLDIPDGLKALKNPDPSVRYNAAELLLRLGPVAKFAVPALQEALKDANGRVRMKVAEALWNIARPPARELLPVLVVDLKDKDPAVRIDALVVLRQMGTAAKAAIPAIARGLKDEDMDVRLEAVLALGEMGSAARETVPALLDALKGDELRLLEPLVAATLGNIGPAAVPALLKALPDKDAARRRTAAYALALIGPQAAEAVPALTEALHDAESEVRALAAKALGKIGQEAKGTAPALATALKDSDAVVRVHAALALWQVDGRSDGLAVLTAALKAKEDRVREHACVALGGFGAKAASTVPALLEAALHDGTARVRVLSAEALGKIGLGKDTAAQLAAALKDEDESVRFSAARALWNTASPKTRGELVTLVADGLNRKIASVRKRAAEVLGEFGAGAKEVVPALLEALRDPDAPVRQAAAAALRQIDPAAAAKAGVR
jgi:HEAT repeat protein